MIHGQENKLCKLDKSLYGLKLAPKQCHERIDNLMISKKYKMNQSDKCICFKDSCCKCREIVVEQQHWYETPRRSWCNSWYQEY